MTVKILAVESPHQGSATKELGLEYKSYLHQEIKKFVHLESDKSKIIKAMIKHCNENLDPSSKAEVLEMVDKIWDEDQAKMVKAQELPEFFSAHELSEMDIKQPLWIIPGILLPGLTILAGKPKCGKSWFAYDLALTMASGGEFLGHLTIEKAPAMMLALEDPKWRLDERMKILLPGGTPSPKGLMLCQEWPKGEVEMLRTALEKYPKTGLLIIDTLELFRPAGKANKDSYAKDYSDMKALKDIADEHGIAIIVIHHERKLKDEDPFEMISGTHGLTGGVDSMWVLKKDKDADFGTLHVTGRDIEGQSFGLKFNNGHWLRHGDFQKLPNKAEIQIMKLLDASTGPLSPKDIADKLGEDLGTVQKRLQRMDQCGFAHKIEHGKYLSVEKAL